MIKVSLKVWKSSDVWDQQQELSSKLNKVCSAIRTIKSLVSLKVLKMMYFCYVHSIISYGIMSQQMYFYHSKKNNLGHYEY